jgi:erythromycin esterase
MKQLMLSFMAVLFIQYGWTQIGEKDLSPLTLNNRSVFMRQLRPLIDEMGTHRIVGLGEGTHGTKEFNVIRVAIIKELVTKKGFNTICFENAYGDSYYLNKLLATDEDITTGMRTYLLAIWQTREIKDLLLWIREYNKSHTAKVNVMGMDFVFMANAARLVRTELSTKGNEVLERYADTLYNSTRYYDSVWTNQNDSSFHFSFDTVLAKVRKARKCSFKIDSLCAAMGLETSDDFKAAQLNIQGFSIEEGRDQSMANMVIQFAKKKDARIIVWAHEVHLALKSAYTDVQVGGTGGFIRKRYTDYYALGMGTDAGTFSATTDRFDSHVNVFRPRPLPGATVGSWDAFFEIQKSPAFFIRFSRINTPLSALPLRLIGYGTNTNDYSDKLSLNGLFDAYIFIRTTTAADHQIY